MSDKLELPEELKDKPIPFQFFVNVADALESKIDYNFNSLVQVSLLVEYLYGQLEKHNISIPLDEEFEKFQESRVNEISEQFNEIKKSIKSPEEVASELMSSVDLEDK